MRLSDIQRQRIENVIKTWKIASKEEKKVIEADIEGNYQMTKEMRNQIKTAKLIEKEKSRNKNANHK